MPTTAPKDFDSLRAAIVEQRDTLPKRLMQVAAYTLEHPDDVAFGTTASIANAAQVQPSTLVRFAQYFGFEGFSGLQHLFQARLKDRNSSYEDRLRQLESGDAHAAESSTIVSGFIRAAHQSLDTLSAALEPDRLERAVDILARAETVYLIARRRSFPLVTSMAYALGKLKDPSSREALLRELFGDRPESRAAAVRALAALGVGPSGSEIEALRADYYREVRRAVEQVLGGATASK